MSTHRCPVKGCTVMVYETMLMCRTHWPEVPQDLQRAVYRTWRARLRGGSVSEHQQACEDAQAAVEGREPERLFA